MYYIAGGWSGGTAQSANEVYTPQTYPYVNYAPTCSVSTPVNNQPVNGTISIQGTASDPNGAGDIWNVQVKVDSGAWVTAAGTSSWTYSLDTSTLSNGGHWIYARAQDLVYEYSTTQSVYISVYNNHFPTCWINSPTTGQIVNGGIYIQGGASDSDGTAGLAQIEIKIDSGSWLLAAGTTSWSYYWSSLSVADGTHTVYARAKDNSSSYSNEASRPINVKNAGDYWVYKTSLPSAREGNAAVSYNGLIYVMGGKNGYTNYGTLYVYNPSTDSWQSGLASMPTARSYLAAVQYAGRIYTFGGYSDGGSTLYRTVEIYDIASNTWTSGNYMPTAKCGVRAVEYNGIIYVIGGFNQVVKNEAMAYCPANNTWWNCAPMPTARCLPGIAVYGGEIYVYGGDKNTDNTVFNNLEIFNPSTNTWRFGAPMPVAKSTVGSTVGSRIYAMGGRDSTYTSTARSDVYDPINGTWSQVQPMLSMTEGASCAVINGNLYVVGGYTGLGNPALSTVEAYIPGTYGTTNTAPVCSISSPTSSAVVNGTVTIAGVAHDANGDATLQKVEIRFDSGAWYPVAGLTSWSYLWATTSATDGTHTVTARAMDTNNSYSAEYSIVVSVQNYLSPNCAISSPANAAKVKGIVTITGTASDPEGAATLVGVEVRIDSGIWGAAAGAASWSYSWDSGSVTNGNHTISAHAIDNHGKYSPAVSVVVYTNNNNFPVCAITSPTQGQTVNGTVSIRGWATDADGNAGLDGVQVKIDGGTWVGAAGAASWAYSWNTTGASEGTHTIYARAQDNKSAYSATVSVGVIVSNTEAPTCTVTAPVADQVLKGTFIFAGTASDPNGAGTIAGVELKFDNGGWVLAAGASSWAYSMNTTTVSDGYHTVCARALDNTGLYSAVASVRYRVQNNILPACTISSPAQSSIIYGTFEVSGIATDPQGAASLVGVEVRIDSGNWVAAAGTSSWKYYWNTFSVADGLHTVSARALNNAAAYSPIASVAVSVLNNRMPSCYISAPAPGSVVSGTTIFSGTSYSPLGSGAIYSVEVKVDSGAWVTAAGTTSWSFYWDTLAVWDGTHYVYARAHDTTGQFSSTCSVRLSVLNNRGPSCSISSPASGATVGSTIVISGSVSDPDGPSNVMGVEVRIDSGGWVGAYGSSSWYYYWNTLSVVDGYHTVYARAVDATSLYSPVVQATVFVLNSESPSCQITSPTSGMYISGYYTVVSDAQPYSIIDHVEFYVDGTLRRTDHSRSYTYSWSTASVSDGPHTLYCVVRDTYGRLGRSADVVVIVNNAPAPVMDRIVLSPTYQSMQVGSSAAFTAVPYDTFGNIVSTPLYWSCSPSLGYFNAYSGNTAVFTATISGAGTISVTGTYNGVTRTATAIVVISYAPNTCVISGRLLDQYQRPMPNTPVALDSTDGTYHAQSYTNSTGWYVFTNVPADKTYIVSVRSQGLGDYTSGALNAQENSTLVENIKLKPKMNEPGILQFSWLIGFFLMLGVGGIAAALLFTEAVKYAILCAVAFPLYSRLRKDKTLDHFVRGQVFTYVRLNPGVHFNAMRKALNLNNGTLTYHLRVLEMQGFVVARRQGIFKRFFQASVKTKGGEGIFRSALQEKILAQVRANPGKCQTELAQGLGIPVSVLNYNINTLIREGAIRIQRDRSRVLCFPATEEDAARLPE